jgi:hypothetical protein
MSYSLATSLIRLKKIAYMGIPLQKFPQATRLWGKLMQDPFLMQTFACCLFNYAILTLINPFDPQ